MSTRHRIGLPEFLDSGHVFAELTHDRAVQIIARYPQQRSALYRAAAHSTRWPRRWWKQQSLRARLTLLATGLFSLAVITGAILVIVLQRYALTRVLDQAAKSGKEWSIQLQ